jgi:hypothetical protein
LPASSSGDYGSHLTLIDAALREERVGRPQRGGGGGGGTGTGSEATATATILQRMAGTLGPPPPRAGETTVSPFDLDNGRKSSSLTQFAAAYVSSLGRSRSSGGGANKK